MDALLENDLVMHARRRVAPDLPVCRVRWHSAFLLPVCSLPCLLLLHSTCLRRCLLRLVKCPSLEE